MCGICGIYGSNNLNVIEEMVASLAHRGPDARYAQIVNGRNALGGARLHIIGSILRTNTFAAIRTNIFWRTRLMF